MYIFSNLNGRVVMYPTRKFPEAHANILAKPSDQDQLSPPN